MWGINVMLKHKKILSVLSLSLVLFSCGKKTNIFGLTPGIYYFESVEGLLPDGWKFDETSYFEFKDATKDNPNFNYKTDLKTGQWLLNRSEPDINDSTFHENYIMQWYNTPFDTLPSLLDGGGWGDKRGKHSRVMYSLAKDTETLEKYYDFSRMFKCTIGFVDKKDDSKRKLTVCIPFNPDLVSQSGRTEITFSM